MILKHADDKSRRIEFLEQIRKSTLLDARQKSWIDDELNRTKRGIEGERDAAHYLDTHWRDSRDHVVLHDLRIVVDDEVAQIDHLIISRACRFYLLETKNFGCNVVISDRGEFTAEYGRQRWGIPSPIEQSRRHEVILARMLERLGITGRANTKPTFQHVVMFAPRAIITRPDSSTFDTRDVIKADQFQTWRENHVEALGIKSLLGVAINMRGQDTVREWGEVLVRQHRAPDPLTLPAFMMPKAQVDAAVQQQLPTTGVPTPPERRLTCITCGAKISFAEGKFCWNNKLRFGGGQYCREHQQQFH